MQPARPSARPAPPTTKLVAASTEPGKSVVSITVPDAPPVSYPPVTIARVVPVAGPIIDPWRPPTNSYGAGNRGIDIGTVPGRQVIAPNAGPVTFAGAVGTSRFVVIAGDDGIRITLGFLASVSVRTGQLVTQGQPVGTSLASVHIGARVGEDYVDPTPLFTGQLHVRLVPTR